jgi:ABC-type enterobactin transport system permease subunit
MVPLMVMSVAFLLICLQFGTQRIGLTQIMDIVGQVLREGTVESDHIVTTGVILIQVRLPRVLLGFLVGACLASVGFVLQALLRNPLADPYVLGVSSGAALGVALAILLGVGTTVMAFSVLPLCGFAGGLLSLVVVYRMAVSYGRLPIHALLLAGVILNAIFSAMIMFVTSIMKPNRSVGTMTWLMGTLTAPSYPASSRQMRSLNMVPLPRSVKVSRRPVPRGPLTFLPRYLAGIPAAFPRSIIAAEHTSETDFITGKPQESSASHCRRTGAWSSIFAGITLVSTSTGLQIAVRRQTYSVQNRQRGI